jgi:hypothetical protein
MDINIKVVTKGSPQITEVKQDKNSLYCEKCQFDTSFTEV